MSDPLDGEPTPAGQDVLEADASLEGLLQAEEAPTEGGPAAPTSVRIRSSAWVFASQVGKTALSIPVGILFARVLHADGKGMVTVVQTTAALICALLNLGMPSAVMWLAARGKATGRSSLLLGGIFAVLSVSLVGIAAAIIGPQALAHRLGLSSGLLFSLALVAIFPAMVGYFIDAYLIGRGAIRLLSTVDVVVLATQLVGMVALAALHLLTPVSAILVWLALSTGTVLFKGAVALRSDEGAHKSVAELWREGRSFALRSWLANTVNMLSLRQDMLLLAALAGAREVGIYSIAVTAAELAWYVPNALQSVATVKFAAGGDETELVERMNRSVWPFTFVFALAVFAVAAPLIPLVYGGVFAASIRPLLFLLPGIVATSMSTSLSAWLTGRGHPQEPAIANGANMAVNLAANLVLAPRFGASGAALASTISYSVGTAVIVWRFRSRTGARVVDILVPRRADLAAMFDIIRTAVTDRFQPKIAG